MQKTAFLNDNDDVFCHNNDGVFCYNNQVINLKVPVCEWEFWINSIKCLERL